MKNKTIQAILIDPFLEKVSEVQVQNNLQGYYQAIGCDTITITSLSFGKKNLDMILDDEGLLKNPDSQRYFKYKLFSQPFAGRALLVSSDRQGNTISVPHDVYHEQVERDIIWYKPQQGELEQTMEFKITSF